VSPSYAAVMPKLVVGTGVGGAIQTAAQAHHFRFIGIEVNPLAGALIYPPENYFPPARRCGLRRSRQRNYRLASSSPYKNAATDGTDIGADIDALEAATAGVVSPTEPAEDTTPPTVTISSPTTGQTVSGVVVIDTSDAGRPAHRRPGPARLHLPVVDHQREQWLPQSHRPRL